MKFGWLPTLHYQTIYVHVTSVLNFLGVVRSVVHGGVYMWKHLLHLKGTSEEVFQGVGVRKSYQSLPISSQIYSPQCGLKSNSSSDLYFWEVPLEKVLENHWMCDQQKVSWVKTVCFGDPLFLKTPLLLLGYCWKLSDNLCLLRFLLIKIIHSRRWIYPSHWSQSERLCRMKLLHPGKLTAGSQEWRWMEDDFSDFNWVIFRFQLWMMVWMMVNFQGCTLSLSVTFDDPPFACLSGSSSSRANGIPSTTRNEIEDGDRFTKTWKDGVWLFLLNKFPPFKNPPPKKMHLTISYSTSLFQASQI